jgi:hypothetical protein
MEDPFTGKALLSNSRGAWEGTVDQKSRLVKIN